MNHGSLFSGIGGFDLAAQWMGWTNEFHCEINPFGQKVLHHYWPEAKQYHDIKTTDFTVHRGLDILTGGFPCQPYSTAGKRMGKEDDRHLWPEMLRAIREIQPRWVVGENVRGLTNWNGGVVFDEVQADLEAEGYQVTPFLLPAGSVNAPHRRDRIWFVAYAVSTGAGCNSKQISNEARGASKNWAKGVRQTHRQAGPGGLNPTGENDASHTHSDQRCKGRLYEAGPEQAERHACSCDTRSYQRDTWQNFPTVAPVCGGDDGIPRELDGITFPKWRNESIKAYGNAIVPQVVFQIFKAIEQYEEDLFGHLAGRGEL